MRKLPVYLLLDTSGSMYGEPIEAVKNGEFDCAFLINPPKVSEIKQIAEDNEKMPQKV